MGICDVENLFPMMDLLVSDSVVRPETKEVRGRGTDNAFRPAPQQSRLSRETAENRQFIKERN